jgi:hypothetical protein
MEGRRGIVRIENQILGDDTWFKMAILRVILSLILVLPLSAKWGRCEVLKIADFDDGHKPNLINGDYGAWDKDGNDPTQFCVESFDRKHAYGGRGCCLQLDYDVDSPNMPAYNGFWMRLEKLDLSKWKYLCFYVKGDPEIGFTEKFKVEIKNFKGQIATFLVNGVSSEWRKVVIPLDKMVKDADFSEVYEFTIVFDEETVTQKIGRIYIDEFYLYK